MESAEDGILFSSGMAAISTFFLALLKPGDHIILQDEIYGGTHLFATHEFKKIGIDYSFMPTDSDEISNAIKNNIKIIFIESPTNPLLSIIDIKKVTDIAKKNHIITLINNTFASPIHQNPLNLSIDIVMHSGTKYLGGHSDIYYGIILTSEDIVNRIKPTAYHFGGSVNATTCALLERSLKTLHIRIERQTENTLKIALFPTSIDLIEHVYYPGLKSYLNHQQAQSQVSGFGAMVSFELVENKLKPAFF